MKIFRFIEPTNKIIKISSCKLFEALFKKKIAFLSINLSFNAIRLMVNPLLIS